MEYKTEKDLTLKQNKIVYEEVYMDDDMNKNKYIEGTGWNLKYPSQFSINHSKDKSIAPRRTLLEPLEYYLKFRVAYYYEDNSDEYNPLYGQELTQYMEGYVNKYMTLKEFLNIMVDQTTIYYEDDNGNPDKTNPRFKLDYTYNKATGQLKFSPKYKPDPEPPEPGQLIIYTDCKFCFLFDTTFDKSAFVELFNQKTDSKEINNICRKLKELNYGWPDIEPYTAPETTIENVWNRDILYLHASFSNSKRHYLCFSNEFWERPSKIFLDNTYGSEFTVYYTTDGIHRLDPLYAHKLIELSFVLRTSTL